MAKDIDLTGKIAVITGAGSGIGRATARTPWREGACSRSQRRSRRRCGARDRRRRRASRAGRHRPQDLEALAEFVYQAEGSVDILRNNAGIGHGGDIETTTVEDWQRVIGVNLLGVAYGMQAFVPRMLEQGHPATIVNTASEMGLIPGARMARYCASKFGVVGMSESLDAELRPHGIRVVALPGIVNTPIVRDGIMRGQLGADQSKIALPKIVSRG
jgi:NAD(P)-dependent dehydrogenase (short-subunit alcohol dehydrogenase family)